jgi:hypothetical protein
LKEFSPKMFTLLLKESAVRKLEREVAVSVGHPSFIGRRACMDISRNFMATKKRSLKEKAVVAAVCCKALWTRKRLKDSGYEIESTLCELCGLEEDTIHHRLYMCKYDKVVEARKAVTDKKFKCEDGVWRHVAMQVFEKAVIDGVDDPLFIHAVCPHPADIFPSPLESSGAQFFRLKQPCPLPTDANGDPCMAVDGKLYNNLFADGSCSKTGFRSLDRASWGVVEVDEDGKAIAGWMGVVPSDMLQTSQAGEYMAAAYAAQVAMGETVLHDDCSNVVRDLLRDTHLLNNESRAYAAPAMKVADWDHYGQMEVIKVKAHVSFQGLEGEDLFRAVGNDAADKFAKAATKIHPQPSVQMAESFKNLKVCL